MMDIAFVRKTRHVFYVELSGTDNVRKQVDQDTFEKRLELVRKAARCIEVTSKPNKHIVACYVEEPVGEPMRTPYKLYWLLNPFFAKRNPMGFPDAVYMKRSYVVETADYEIVKEVTEHWLAISPRLLNKLWKVFKSK